MLNNWLIAPLFYAVVLGSVDAVVLLLLRDGEEEAAVDVAAADDNWAEQSASTCQNETRQRILAFQRN
jgi:hypothetical protein